MKRLAGLPLLIGLLAAAIPAGAALSLTSGANTLARTVDNGGGGISSSASNQLTGNIGDAVAITTMASASNRVRAGWSEIAYFPGVVGNSTAAADISITSATLNWSTTGQDGNLGVLPSGSKYLIQIASAGFDGRFANVGSIDITISTNGRPIGEFVGGGVTGLLPNTTYFVKVWVQDNDSNVYAGAVSTVTSLAIAPSQAALQFLSVQWSSATVQWIANPSAPPDASSKTTEGYVLLASSNNFGALAPPGAPVFSSTTYGNLASTLTVSGLDLSNTYYFQVASLNHEGRPNYTQLTRLNFQITQSTGLIHLGAMGNVAGTLVISTVSTSSMVVTNVGNYPATILLSASTATVGSTWLLGTQRDIDTALLQGEWASGAVGPSPASFTTALTTTTRISQASGNYSGTQNGVQLPSGSSITLWFRLQLPTSSSPQPTENFSVFSQPVYP